MHKKGHVPATQGSNPGNVLRALPWVAGKCTSQHCVKKHIVPCQLLVLDAPLLISGQLHLSGEHHPYLGDEASGQLDAGNGPNQVKLESECRAGKLLAGSQSVNPKRHCQPTESDYYGGWQFANQALICSGLIVQRPNN